MLSLLCVSFSLLFLNSEPGNGMVAPQPKLPPAPQTFTDPPPRNALTLQAGGVELDEELGAARRLHNGLDALKLNVRLIR